MTVQTSTTVATGIGNGVTTVFPIGFKFNQDEDLIVNVVDDAAQTETLLTLYSDYTVTGAGDENGGSITLTSGPLATGKRVVTKRVISVLQLTDLRNQGKFFAEVHEDSFDKGVMIDQQQQEQIDRGLFYDLLGRWNAFGRRIINLGTPTQAADATRKDYVDAGDQAAKDYADDKDALNFSKTLRTPEPVGQIGSVESRANRLLSFDSLGNPIAVAPVSGSATDLAMQLADQSSPSLGARLIGWIRNAPGAVGLWVYDKLSERVTPEDFGAIGDGTSHPLSERFSTLAAAQAFYSNSVRWITSLDQEIDYAAIMAAIESQTFGVPFYIGGPKVHLRDGAHYYCGSSTIELKRFAYIVGNHSGQSGGPRLPKIRFAPGSAGVIVHRFNTIGAQIESVPTTGGDGSVLQGFRIEGARGVVDAKGGHGLWMRARATLKEMNITSFEGNNVHIKASAAGGPDSMGNANNWRIETCTLASGAHGLYIEGADANAGWANGVDAGNNRLWGILDNSFLGNQFLNCHGAANGIEAGVATAYARFGGNVYHADLLATPAQLEATEPGTDGNIWRSCNNTSYAFDWVSGANAGKFRTGGCYASRGLSNRNTWTGCYAEGGQGLTQGSQHSMFIGGFLVETPVVTGNFIAASANRIVANSLRTTKNGVSAFLSEATGTTQTVFGYQKATPIPVAGDYRFKFIGEDLVWDYLNGAQSALISGAGTTLTFGRASALPHKWHFPDVIGFGAGGTLKPFGRAPGTGTTLPTSGEYARGEIRMWANPVAGASWGFICTVGGTAGSTAVFKLLTGVEA